MRAGLQGWWRCSVLQEKRHCREGSISPKRSKRLGTIGDAKSRKKRSGKRIWPVQSLLLDCESRLGQGWRWQTKQ
jgi:hypothetical protein